MTLSNEAQVIDRHRAILTVDDLSFSFGRRRVIDGLEFTLRPGEILGLLGPNGCGKSTALALISGLHTPANGTIEFFGTTMSSRHQAVRRRTGHVFQSPCLDPKLTVRQNLELIARIHGLVSSRASHAISRQLSWMGLNQRADDNVNALSGGMRRRLDIARALLHGPDLLLMDEPTAGLDEFSFRHTWSRLHEMRREDRLSILVATHRPEEAEQCDRLIVLDRGSIVRTGTPEALKRDVANDVVIIQAPNIALLRDEIEAAFDLTGLLHNNELLIACDEGHQLIPRIVERFPDGRLSSISLRRPSLADVFLKLTGNMLEDTAQGAANE